MAVTTDAIEWHSCDLSRPSCVECASRPDGVVGLSGRVLALGRTYAPKAKVGVPSSFFGQDAVLSGQAVPAVAPRAVQDPGRRFAGPGTRTQSLTLTQS